MSRYLLVVLIFISSVWAGELEDCLNKGHALYKDKRYDDALQEYDRAISLDSESLEA
ncbi:tetratricopeptide repeat protein, partial [bacterium]|nr:tetratricopeptide repeat protein [bacterium]